MFSITSLLEAVQDMVKSHQNLHKEKKGERDGVW